MKRFFVRARQKPGNKEVEIEYKSIWKKVDFPVSFDAPGLLEGIPIPGFKKGDVVLFVNVSVPEIVFDATGGRTAVLAIGTDLNITMTSVDAHLQDSSVGDSDSVFPVTAGTITPQKLKDDPILVCTGTQENGIGDDPESTQGEAIISIIALSA